MKRNEIAGILARLLIRIHNLIVFHKPLVFVYTDSRGYKVESKWGKNPLNSYIRHLLFKYRLEYSICEYKHTTILDFLNDFSNFDVNKYDSVVLHCGVVDFSPRPINSIKEIHKTKENILCRYTNCETNYSDTIDHENLYNGEVVASVYSTTVLKDYIIPRLNNFNNLIWLSSNQFVNGWNGTYYKERPANIGKVVNTFDLILIGYLHSTINLYNWSDELVKEFTSDNIHFTDSGMKEVALLISDRVENALKGS